MKIIADQSNFARSKGDGVSGRSGCTWFDAAKRNRDTEDGTAEHPDGV